MPEQPGILVRLGMHGRHTGTFDVDALDDLVERFFPEPVQDGRVPPEGAEVPKERPRMAQARLIGGQVCGTGARYGPVEATSGAAERFDPELAPGEPGPEVGAGRLLGGKVGRWGDWLGPAHRS